MKISIQIKLLVYILLIILSSSIHAQVSIGSINPPSKGALLQVKSHDADGNNITANKGVLLPRVALNRLNTLEPFDSSNSANPITRALHTGLFVFNTTDNPAGYINGVSGAQDINYVLVPGVYVWDGAKWKALKYTKFPIINFTCTGSNSVSLAAGGTVPPGTTYLMAYTSDTPGATIPAYTDTKNGITVSYTSQVLALSGTIQVSVSGTLDAGVTSSFSFDLGKYFCPFTIDVTGTALDITCNPLPAAITGQVGTFVNEVVKISYDLTGVNYNLFNETVGTSGNGLTATIATQILTPGTGTIDVTISGTPTSALTNYPLQITIAGQVCEVTVNVSNIVVNCNPTPATITGQANVSLNQTVTIDYEVTGGTTYALAAATVGSSGNGLTATIAAQTLNPGMGTIDVTITGTPTSALTNYKMQLTIAGQVCEVTVNVSDIAVTCNPTPATITGPVNTLLSQTVTIDYTVTGGTYALAAATVGSSGNGLTATIAAQTLNPGTGTIDVTITGTPTSVLTNYALELTIAGQVCTVTVNVTPGAPVLSLTNCDASTQTARQRMVFANQTLTNYTYTINYTSSTVGAILPAYSSTQNDVTVSYPETTLAASGSITVSVNGTPKVIGTSVYNVDFAGVTCNFSLEVVALPVLQCPIGELYPGLVTGTVISTPIVIEVPYTGGIPNSQMVGSPATVTSGTLTYTISPVSSVPVSGNGTITVTITGTVPSGQATLNLNMNVTGAYGLDNGAGVNSLLKVGCDGLFLEGKSLACYGEDLPNCYMVTPTQDSIEFPVLKAYIGWENQKYLKLNQGWKNGTTATADIEWSTTSGGFTNSVSLNGSGRTAKIVVKMKQNVGNGSFIVHYKMDGVTIWTWHIWVTPYSPDPAAISIMNQNLGAQCGLTPTRGVSDRGFFYMWGRKDPIPQSFAAKSPSPASAVSGSNQTVVYKKDGSQYTTGSIAYGMRVNGQMGKSGKVYIQDATNEPFIFWGSNSVSNESDWYAYTDDTTSGNPGEYDNTLWGDSDQMHKGLFDPCPPGWRVPTNQEMNQYGMYSATGLLANTGQQPISAASSGNISTSDNTSTIPCAGYFITSTAGGQYYNVGYGAYFWSQTNANLISGYNAFHSHISKAHQLAASGNTVTTAAGAGADDSTIAAPRGGSFGKSIRCVKSNCN